MAEDWKAEFERLGEEEIRDKRRYPNAKLWRDLDGKRIPGKLEAAGRWLDRKSSKVQTTTVWLAVISALSGVAGALIGAVGVYLAMKD